MRLGMSLPLSFPAIYAFQTGKLRPSQQSGSHSHCPVKGQAMKQTCSTPPANLRSRLMPPQTEEAGIPSHLRSTER